MEQIEIAETKPAPYGTIDFVAHVDINPSCRLELGGYIASDLDRVYLTRVGNVTTDCLAQFAVWLLVNEKSVIKLVKEKHTRKES